MDISKKIEEIKKRRKISTLEEEKREERRVTPNKKGWC